MTEEIKVANIHKKPDEREAWLFKNKDAIKKVRAGLNEAAAGRVSKRGDFSQFLDMDFYC